MKTLVSVKDGQIWEERYISMLMDTITHVGESSYCGRFFDDLYQVMKAANLLTIDKKSNKVLYLQDSMPAQQYKYI